MKLVIFLNFLSGGLAGFTTTPIVYPLDFCQTKISADLGTGIFLLKSNQFYKYSI